MRWARHPPGYYKGIRRFPGAVAPGCGVFGYGPLARARSQHRYTWFANHARGLLGCQLRIPRVARTWFIPWVAAPPGLTGFWDLLPTFRADSGNAWTIGCGRLHGG